jgi:hypothetical protein
MNMTSFTISRGLRLALLLLMLASQGIANAHALDDSHSLEKDNCATCIIGHGLGAALGDSYEAAPVQVVRVLLPRPVNRLSTNCPHHLSFCPRSPCLLLENTHTELIHPIWFCHRIGDM